MIVNDIFLGELEYDGYDWIKHKFVCSFFGKSYELDLKIIGRTFNSNEQIKQIQRDTYINYKNEIHKINSLVEESLYNFYQSECDEYRKMFDDEKDLLAPIIKDKKELCNLVDLVCIFIGNCDNRVLFFMFDTVWDDEGISVKLIDEKLDLIGGFSEMYI